jgi:hypothetical protein
MSENSMGNVDNRANIGNQTIINIQNMPGNIVLPDNKVKSGNTPSESSCSPKGEDGSSSSPAR